MGKDWDGSEPGRRQDLGIGKSRILLVHISTLSEGVQYIIIIAFQISVSILILSVNSLAPKLVEKAGRRKRKARGNWKPDKLKGSIVVVAGLKKNQIS